MTLNNRVLVSKENEGLGNSLSAGQFRPLVNTIGRSGEGDDGTIVTLKPVLLTKAFPSVNTHLELLNNQLNI